MTGAIRHMAILLYLDYKAFFKDMCIVNFSKHLAIENEKGNSHPNGCKDVKK